MKRLLAQIGITCFAVLAIAFYLPEKAVFALFAVASIATFILFAVRKTRKKLYIPLVALTITLSCFMNLAYSLLYVTPIQDRYTGSAVAVEATLTDEVYRSYSKYCYRLKTDRINGEDVSVNLLLQTPVEIGIEPFDQVSFKADVNRTDNQYYLSKGYYLSVYIDYDTFDVVPCDEKPLYSHIIILRQRFREALDAYLPEDCASLCKAIFVGDKYALDPTVKKEFRHAGASYFVVVSGMHFAVLCMILLKILRRFRSHRVLIFAVMVPVILLYMFVTGMQPSVVRSGIMMLMLMLGLLFRRLTDPHTSLGLAGLLLPVIFSPFGAGDIGLILSFFTTYSIITWADPIAERIRYKGKKRILKKILNPLAELIAVGLAANIFVFPLSIFAFNAFSTVTLVSSLLLYLPVEIILILSIFLCLLFYLGPLRYLALLLSWPLYALCNFVLWIVRGLSSLPFSYIYVGAEYVYIWLAVTIILAAVVYLLRRKVRLLPYAAMLSAFILFGGMLLHTVNELNTVSLQVYNCAQGLTVGLDYHGDLYFFGFKSKSKEAYDLLDDIQLRYGRAEVAVCSEKADFKNYSRLTDREFAISGYLLYDIEDAKGEEAELMIANGLVRYAVDADVFFKVYPAKKKVLTYLTVGDADILILPNHYPYNKIPEKCRKADMIVMTTYAEGYENLSCETLVISNTYLNCLDIAEQMQGAYLEIMTTSSGSLSIDLR